MSTVIQYHIETLDEIAKQVQLHFGNMDTAALNWKPSPDAWSIAQVLDHIMVSDSTYYPQFDALLAGTHRQTWYMKIRFISRFWGARLIKDAGPVISKKFKNPAVFSPSQSALPADILNRFAAHQKQMKEYFMKLQSFDPQITILYSPVTKLITYNLADLFQILLGHQQRHIGQALRVLASMNKCH